MVDPAPFPLSLATLLAPPPAPPRGPSTSQSGAVARCLAYLKKLPEAIAGSGGHNATFRAACEIWRFGLDDAQAWDALTWFNSAKCQPPWGEGELRHKLESARERVAEEGRTGVRLDERVYGYSVNLSEVFVPEVEQPAPNGNGVHHDESPAPDKAERPPVIKDTQLRDRYMAAHRLTAFGLGGWRRHEGGVWGAVHKAIVEKEIQAVIDEEAARDVRMRPSSNMLFSVRKLIEVQLTLPEDQWDCDPDLLVCTNGTLHIPTLELRKHSPSHYITSGVPYAYDPLATAPAWERMLNEVYGEVREFLQEFAGYCLTTSTRYETAVWLYGDPGGGKSTFILGLETMLGKRAGLLGLSDIERSGFMLMELVGKTLVTATEQPNDFMAAMSTVNKIISGESVLVDIKFKDPITITPTAKVLWSMNDLPRVTDANNGIFRRVKVVRVPPLPEKKRDPAVKEAIAHEGPGILNWALEGLRRLNDRGWFVLPESVKAETEEFKASSDVEHGFIADACRLAPNSKVKSSKLYAAYSEWCKTNGHKPKSSTRVSRDWERLGFERSAQMDGRYWNGVELIQPEIFMGGYQA
jgi:P4 family phage/plasmid primase-like protien